MLDCIFGRDEPIRFVPGAIERWSNLFRWHDASRLTTRLPPIHDDTIHVKVIGEHRLGPTFMVTKREGVEWKWDAAHAGECVTAHSRMANDPVDLVTLLRASPHAGDLAPLLDTFPDEANLRVRVAQRLLAQ